MHETVATRLLTGFARLTPDHLDLRTTFGDGVLTMTANFSTTTYRGLRPGCVQAELPVSPRRGQSATAPVPVGTAGSLPSPGPSTVTGPASAGAVQRTSTMM
jgi:hypothetical protein